MATFLMTIDVEPDLPTWSKDVTEFHCTNIPVLERLQEIGDRYGARPTYLATYAVATDPGAEKVLARLAATGRCETARTAADTPPKLDRLHPETSIPSPARREGGEVRQPPQGACGTLRRADRVPRGAIPPGRRVGGDPRAARLQGRHERDPACLLAPREGARLVGGAGASLPSLAHRSGASRRFPHRRDPGDYPRTAPFRDRRPPRLPSRMPFGRSSPR
jgi:hypothetical protein